MGKEERFLLFHLYKILDFLFSAEDEELKTAILDKANNALFELTKKLEKLKEAYRLVEEDEEGRLLNKALEELQAEDWRMNEDGSRWLPAAKKPYLKKLLEESGGKLSLENYRIYLSRSGYIKVYEKGGRNV